jgi:nicotinate phosphoribosyltransferase
MLDDAGFPETNIVLSNQMDELTVWQILTQIGQEARSYGVDPDSLANRLIYGVGTNLITSAGDSALDGVYKLVAIQEQGGDWTPAIKISETPEKTPNPGRKRVWRLYDRNERATADLICLEEEEPAEQDELVLRHPTFQHFRRTLRRDQISRVEPLLEKVLVGGAITYSHRTIDEMRSRRVEDVNRLDEGVKRLINPHVYHVSLSESLWQLKQKLVREARNG